MRPARSTATGSLRFLFGGRGAITGARLVSDGLVRRDKFHIAAFFLFKKDFKFQY